MQRPGLLTILPICVLLLAMACSCSSSSDGGSSDADVVDASIAADGASDGAGEVPLDAITDAGEGDVIVFEHAGVSAWEEGGVVRVTSDRLTLGFDLARGTYLLGVAGGLTRIRGAEARVLFERDGEEARVATSDEGARSWEAAPFGDPLGDGVSVTVTVTPVAGGPSLRSILVLRAGASFLTARAEVIWDEVDAARLRVTRMSPLVVDDATAGALFVGPDPVTHRVLDNGFDLYFDYDGRVTQVGQAKSVFFAPGTTSNWNMAVHDPETREAIVAGFLSNRRGGGLIALHHDEEAAVSEAGRVGFTRFEGLCHYLEGRRPMTIGAGAALESERFYLDVDPPSTLEGLEAFARRYAARIHKEVRTDVPTGWNSWGGGSAAGGKSSDIDEAYILANLEHAAADFAPYGMRYFLIDDGWQADDGDWVGHAERFPIHGDQDGMHWMADQIRAKGMTPGVWIAPFRVSHESQLAAAHPEWAAEITPMGQGIVEPHRYLTLDISNPEVLDYVEETFTRVTQEWGYRWIKMDFSYYTLFATKLHDPEISASEAYVNALHRVREAIGPETFLLTVSGQGLCFEDGDGARITLDNGPFWGGEASGGDPGIKVIYRTIAHRYYLNHNLWINHPDLLFFRDIQGLTLDEARSWTSAVALSGGVVKLAESYQDMHAHPEWRAMVTPRLPVYPASGRPLDLFEREFPEVWHLPVTRTGRAWSVVGLFNWGTNREIGAAKYEDEIVRTIGVDLVDIGHPAGVSRLVFDAWAHTWEWTEGARLERSLDPRRSAVLIVREAPSEPAVVFTTRHLMGGAVEIHDEAWDPEAGTLMFDVDAVPGDPITIYVATAGRELTGVEAAAATDLEHELVDGLAVVRFMPTHGPTLVVLRF